MSLVAAAFVSHAFIALLLFAGALFIRRHGVDPSAWLFAAGMAAGWMGAALSVLVRAALIGSVK